MSASAERTASAQEPCCRAVWIDWSKTLRASASCPVYPLLKRPDERYVTMQAYDNPVFVEDMVRNVAIRLKDSATFKPFMQTFLYVQQASDIQGSVAMLLGTRFQSFRVGSAIYHVGILPWWTKLTLWFMEVPWLAAVVVLVLAFLLAIWTRQWLRQKARSRLKMIAD